MKSADKKTIYDVTKIYPDHVKVLRFNVAFDITLGTKPITEKKDSWLFPKIFKNRNEDRAARRAKTAIHDLVLCNNFEHFVTLTFDKSKVKSRYDLGLLKTMAHRWFESQRRKYGKFGYVLVTELHQDGAIHFHGLFQGFKAPLVDSGVKHGGKTVYNCPTWPYGYSTFKEITQTEDDRHKVAAYCTKYVSKDMVRFPGGKRFWVSQDLNRPEKLVNDYHANPSSEIYCAT